MKNTIKITLSHNIVKEYPKGISLGEISETNYPNPPYPFLGALVDNIPKELRTKLNHDCHVVFIDMRDRDGILIYKRGLCFVLIRACKELFADRELIILHSISKGFFCEFSPQIRLNREILQRIERKMVEIINSNEPFIKKNMPLEEAIELFEESGNFDKVRLFRYRRKNSVHIYKCGQMIDYFYGFMPPNTSCLKNFEIVNYPPGFILRFPSPQLPDIIPSFIENRKLFDIYYEHKKWCRILDVADIGSLNDVIARGEINEFIRIAEALHEKKAAHIADLIKQEADRIKLILIAGPSSSGKTTFAQRLSVQLKVNGLKPVSIHLDDYFRNREETPKDEHGDYDFEALEAIDVDLFNEHLLRLINGEEVLLPSFNFTRGCSETSNRRIKITSGQLLIVEGIHGLNEKLTESIPRANKFKIYVSALTQLNIDNHNRIPTTDNRLIRRIVRDHQFRSYHALDTLRRWPSVRRGEEKNIFPFQEEADVMFNSALVYELGVLRTFVEPLLEEIDTSHPEYSEARRLLRFVGYCLPVGTDEIPPNSILREFIGATYFIRLPEID